jgi:molybdopterin-containing oxidoreductase family membrane subunit
VSTTPETYSHSGSEPPLITGNQTFGSVTEKISGIAERKVSKLWYLAITVSGSLTALLFVSIAYLFWEGIGIWGVNNPVGWGWAIINFVFWVGIGHAGTLISAILFLLRQKWRTSINRFAEAMTLMAVTCALIFPGIHVGRIWVAYFMFPLPNQMQMWPNFRSPLLWDVFAVGTYFTASLLFWYVGLIPDLATLRDRAKNRFRKIILGIFSVGWRGGNRQWKHYELAYLILAGISTPLVLSVHSVVSTDFAVSILPGWHTTIFPPYFVAGAIFSGFAMVMTLSVIVRKIFNLQNFITLNHLEKINKVMLLTGMMVGYAYSIEFFIAWYSGNIYEAFAFVNRAVGPYAWAYWTMISCNVLVPQLFWFKKLRRSIPVMFAASILINVGMWFERFVIVVSSLANDFLPASWDYYKPTFWDISTFVGSFGLFFTLLLLFVRFVPMIAISEVKGVLPQADRHSPFPIHGMDDAMGLKRSPLGWIVGLLALGGGLGLLGLQWWSSSIAYPLVISGKPLFSFQAYVPVTFAGAVICAAFAATFGMLMLNQLPRLHHPVFHSDKFDATNDGFFISIEAGDPKFDPDKTADFLKSIGVTDLEVLQG